MEKREQLPNGWQVATSRSKNLKYYYNPSLMTQYWVDEELPLGWSHQFDTRTSQKYYFHISNEQKTKTYEKPTEKTDKEYHEKFGCGIASTSHMRAPSATLGHDTRENAYPSKRNRSENIQNDPNSNTQPPIARRNSLHHLLSPATLSPPHIIQSHNEQQTNQDSTQAAHFYNQLQRNTVSDRANSLLFHLRALNNWVKTIIIQQYAKRRDVVLDLACGKGGDLMKWIRKGIVAYVGVDIANQSLENAISRLKSHKQSHTLSKVLLVEADLGRVSLRDDPALCWTAAHDWHTTVPLKEKLFDIISIQFAIHYMFGTKERAQRCFQTFREMLHEGGIVVATTVDPNQILYQYYQNLTLDKHLDDTDGVISICDEKGRQVCTIRLDASTKQSFLRQKSDAKNDCMACYGLRYHFTLRDEDDEEQGKEAVDAPEYLIRDDMLEELAQEFGFEIIRKENFHPFVVDNLEKYRTLLDRMHVFNIRGTLSDAEWAIAGLYQVLVLKKVSST